MAIPYTKLDPQPANLAESEIALEHTDGALVAVSVVSKWLTNGAGMSFECKARWIDADGTSHKCPFDQEIHTTFIHVASHSFIDLLTQEVIMRELTYALLGCDLTTQTVDDDVVALVPLTSEMLSGVNIHTAIAAAMASGAQDMSDALGL